MADWVDDANEVVARATAAAIDSARRKASDRVVYPQGQCHFCDELVLGQKLFCDSDCSEMWEKSRRSSNIIVE